jgi:hypothetical protein
MKKEGHAVVELEIRHALADILNHSRTVAAEDQTASTGLFLAR